MVYTPENEDFRYSADDLMTYFTDKKVDTLLLINPDNPTGNYIPKQDVLRLAKWAGEHLTSNYFFSDFPESPKG